MIKAKELRIGNWVTFKGKPGKVYHLRSSQREPISEIFVADEVPYSEPGTLDDIEPIILTSEILEKCGLENDFYLELNNGRCIRVDVEGKQFAILPPEHVVAGHEVTGPMEYLHQLMNLYHSLTGQELDVKL